MATKISPSYSYQSLTVITLVDEAYTLDKNDCPCLFINTGATTTSTVTLPQDADGGEVVEVACTVAQDIRLDPGAAGAIYGDDASSWAKQTDNKYINGDALGEAIKLVSDGNGDWVAINQSANDAAAGNFNEVES
jgi:hypothetical protein